MNKIFVFVQLSECVSVSNNLMTVKSISNPEKLSDVYIQIRGKLIYTVHWLILKNPFTRQV